MTVSVIAEVGVNHNGDLGIATELIDVAAEAGCPFVKFQSFKADRLVSPSVHTAIYQQDNTGVSTQHELLSKLELSAADHERLLAHAEQRQIQFVSTAFDVESLLFLNSLGVPFLKVPSGELLTTPLLLAIGQTHKPVIVSTGMATLAEIETALNFIAFGRARDDVPRNTDQVRQHWVESCDAQIEDVTLLHCTSQYPAPPEQINLSAIQTMQQCFGIPVGYSDHTMGIVAPVIAVCFGATVIEKHITLDRSMPGPDHKASLEPDELHEMVRAVNEADAMIGDGRKRPSQVEFQNRQLVRHRIVATRDIKAGEYFSVENLGTMRHTEGLGADHYFDLVGTQASKELKQGQPIE